MTYNSTLTKVFVYLLTSIEAIYQTSVPLEVQNRKNVHLATSDCLVITCYLWGVLHFSETLKAKHQLAQSLFPNFLEYSRFVHRCNALLLSIQLIRQALVFKEVEGIDVSIIDSFPIPLCQPIRNFRSKVLGDYANIGYNATKGQYFYGCKCHALVSESGYVIDYVISPASIGDSTMAEEVLSQFGTPIVLGDMGYLGQVLQDRLELKEIELITPVRMNTKKKDITFPNFSKRRKVIERVFSFLTNLGAERCKSRSSYGFQVKLEMTLLTYSLILKSAKTVNSMTLRYSTGYQVMAE
ncbi:IS982 family transposase [Lactococcus lactis]|uniref:IS982 family transposase n=1 Tax=Lactococcus lactis TaxID=1358 RepID=UPI0021AEAA39|nr:IS982 family transposase [Lactococcus lactis]MCT0080380.1 IS982 family transposase [Lactococcus lactis subsp. lactis]MCT0442442.1 IS982 family transposase [Lactococcus lactis subsp. lactis]